MSATAARATVDMRGRKITTFILHSAAMKLREMKEGEVLEIRTDAYEPIESDIRAWCRMAGHTLLELDRDADGETYRVETGTPKAVEHQLAVVISNAGLEELLSPLGFALAAALGGTEVHIYFQGPAVKVLKKGFRERLQGAGRLFSAFAQNGLAKIGHLPPQDKLAQLRELGAKLYICAPSMEHFGVTKSQLAFDGVIVAEYLTFMEVMTRADIHVFLQ